MLSVYCHLAVALNYQNARRPIFLNESKFRQNGGCGYILKPKFLCGDTDYDPDAVMDYRWGASCGLVHSENLADHVGMCWRDKYWEVALFEICAVSWKCLVVVWSLVSLLYRCIFIYLFIYLYIYSFIHSVNQWFMCFFHSAIISNLLFSHWVVW